MHSRIATLIGNQTSQALSLLSNDHEFKSFQDYWRLLWSLTSGSIGLVEVRVNWSGHPC